MAINIKDLIKAAERETTLSAIMVGRVKLGMDEVIHAYPDGVRIDCCDMVSYTNGDGSKVEFPVLGIMGEDKCFFGGAVISNIIKAWLEMVGGDFDVLNDTLTAGGGIRLKFTQGRTKRGNNITNVEVLKG